MATAFDTLKLATRLEAAGVAREQAIGTSEALAEAMSSSDVATSHDVLAVKNDLRGEIQAVKTELRSEIQAVRNDLAATRGELQGEIKDIDHKIELLRSETKLMGRNLLIGLGSLIVAMAGIILGVLPLLLR